MMKNKLVKNLALNIALFGTMFAVLCFLFSLPQNVFAVCTAAVIILMLAYSAIADRWWNTPGLLFCSAGIISSMAHISFFGNDDIIWVLTHFPFCGLADSDKALDGLALVCCLTADAVMILKYLPRKKQPAE